MYRVRTYTEFKSNSKCTEIEYIQRIRMYKEIEYVHRVRMYKKCSECSEYF